MFLDESTVSILFRLINFCVFTFLVWYLFKKYIIDTVKKQIVDKQQALVDLRDQANVLVDDIRKADQAITYDEHMCQELKARVVKWRARAERFAQENTIKKQEQMQLLADHMHIQAMYLQRMNTYERILPRVLDQTRKQLEQKFENEDLEKEFIAQIIGSMQKGEMR